MEDYMRSYMRRWRRTNAQVAVVIEIDCSDNEVPNQAGVREDPILNNLDDERILRNLDDTLHSDEDNEDVGSFSPVSLELLSEDDEINACNADENVSLENELGEWQTKHKLTQEALNHLLDILRRQRHILPKDCRALMKTPRKINIRELC